MEVPMRTTIKNLVFGTVCACVSWQVAAQVQGNTPDWLSQAKIVANMQNITVGEAVRRARLQALVDRQTARFEQDDDFGGSWIVQNKTGFTAHFAFKGGARRPIGDPELAQASSFENTHYSLKELHAERQRLGSLLKAAGIDAGFAVRIPTSQLELYPSDPAKVRQMISAGSLTVRDFVVVVDKPLRRHNESVVSGGGPTTGTYVDPADGLTYGNNCTAAFTDSNGSVRGISTAGHCAQYSGQTSNHRDLPIGSKMGYQYSNGIDAAWFRNSSNTYDNHVLYQTSYYAITSTGQLSPPPGTAICVIKRDGTQPCGYASMQIYFGTTDGPYTAMDRHITVAGDSGGPWLYGGVAYGIHSGDADLSDGTTRSFFTSVAALPNMGISVVTTP
jgi:hypothetical protein